MNAQIGNIQHEVAGQLGYTNILLWDGSFGDSVLLSPDRLMAEARKWLRPGTIMLGHANHPTVTELLPEIRDLIRTQIVRRLLPEIERYFQFQATRMDRYIVACYDSEVGGHFHRHRDNVNAGAQHRRFAVSINLNNNFEGCDLTFPEFGRKTYRPSEGGALVFSCGALHQVTPVTKGRRYAFLAFLYGEEDAKKREANNARLHIGETLYTGTQDRLFPEEAQAPDVAAVA